MYLQANITYLRTVKNISSYRMAHDLGMSLRTASYIEHKDSESIRLKTVMRVAEYFGVSLDDLVYKDLRNES